jgi:hypothetical protein
VSQNILTNSRQTHRKQCVLHHFVYGVATKRHSKTSHAVQQRYEWLFHYWNVQVQFIGNTDRWRHWLDTCVLEAATISPLQYCAYVLTKVKVKVKVKLSLCFNWAPRYEGVLGEWRYSSTHSLTSALDGGEWSASRLGRFTPRERAPGTHWRLSGPQSRSGRGGEEKNSQPSPEIEP